MVVDERRILGGFGIPGPWLGGGRQEFTRFPRTRGRFECAGADFDTILLEE